MKICLIGTVAASTLNFRKNLIELIVAQGHEIHVFATDYTESSRRSMRGSLSMIEIITTFLILIALTPLAIWLDKE